MAERSIRSRRAGRTGFESPGALVGVPRSGLIQGLANAVQIGLVRGRKRVQVVKFHVIAASVVIAADEPRIRLECRCRRSRRRSRTSARLAMAAKSRALGPPRRPPQAPQSCADSCGLLRLVDPWPRITTMRAKPLARPAGPRTLATLFGFFRRREARQQTRHGTRATARCSASASVPCAAPEETPCSATRRSRAYWRGASRWPISGTAESNPSAVVDSHPRTSVLRGNERIPHQQTENSPAPAAALQQRAVFRLGLFKDGVPGLHHYRAKRGAMRVVDSLVVHGNAEVPGGAESLHFRVHFFERAPHGLLALVDAEEDLRGRPWLGGRTTRGISDGSPARAGSRVRASAHRPSGGFGGVPVHCMLFTSLTNAVHSGVGKPGYFIGGKRYYARLRHKPVPRGSGAVSPGS